MNARRSTPPHDSDATTPGAARLQRGRAAVPQARAAKPSAREGEGDVSSRLLWPLLRVFHDEPALIRRVLAEHDLTADDIQSPELRIPSSVCYDIYARAAQHRGAPGLGLRAGALARPSDLGLLHYLARSSATLREVVTLGTRYAPLLLDVLELSMITQDSLVHLRFAVPGAPPLVMDALAAGLARTMGAQLDLDIEATHRATSPRRLPLVALHVAHARPSYAADYERVFGLAPMFGRDHYAFVLPSALLDAPLLHADAEVRAHLEQKAAELLRTRTVDKPWTTRVLRIVRQSLPNGQPTVSSIAKRLGTSRATLNRRLADEQATFSDLLGRVRVDLGTHLLRSSSLSIAEISHALGFSEVAAFHRAFKRWTSENPGDYRDRERRAQADGPSSD
jgi:AraC-like DNA-binding protein